MKQPSAFFDKEQAASYDERFAKLAPMRDSLHLHIRILLSDLQDKAKILCVGAGTGAEIIALAKAFPSFEFTAVEPSEPMLEIFRKRAVEEGIVSRCTFHNGYLHTLPLAEPFDAATSLLVSQFLVNRTDRVAFFAEIAQRLKPSGYLVNADLSSDLESENAEGLKDFWRKMLLFSGVPMANANDFLEGWKRAVGVLAPDEVKAMISAGGFEKPTLFYQNIFIHAWCARKAKIDHAGS